MPKEQLKVAEFPGYFSDRTRAPCTSFPAWTLTPKSPTRLMLRLSMCGCYLMYPLACCSCYFGCPHIWPGATRAGQITCYCPRAEEGGSARSLPGPEFTNSPSAEQTAPALPAPTLMLSQNTQQKCTSFSNSIYFIPF